MESLTGVPDDGANGVENVQSPTDERRAPKPPDRIAIGIAEAARVDAWIKQASDSSRGFLSPTRAEVIAYLIGEKPDELSAKDIQKLRWANYDPIRHINWLMPQLKAALASGDQQRVADLQAELRGVELSVVKSAKATTRSIQAEKAGAPAVKKRREKTGKTKRSAIREPLQKLIPSMFCPRKTQ